MNDSTSVSGTSAGERASGGVEQNRSATWSLWLGVCGVAFGFLLMFAVLTPAAIIYGVRGLREIRAQPSLRGRGRAWAGIGLGAAAPILWVGVFVALLNDGLI